MRLLLALACTHLAATLGRRVTPPSNEKWSLNPALDLDAESMAAALRLATPLFVNFGAPAWCQKPASPVTTWCSLSKQVSPMWNSMLELDLDGASLGAVDCTRQEASVLCRRYGITSYPTLLLFSDGRIKLFSGKRALPELAELLRFARGGFRQAPDHMPPPLPPSTAEGKHAPRRSTLREQMDRTIPPTLRRAMDRALEPDSWPPLARLAALLLALGAGVQLIVGCYSCVFDRQSLRKTDIRNDFLKAQKKKGDRAAGQPPASQPQQPTTKPTTKPTRKPHAE